VVAARHASARWASGRLVAWVETDPGGLVDDHLAEHDQRAAVAVVEREVDDPRGDVQRVAPTNATASPRA